MEKNSTFSALLLSTLLLVAGASHANEADYAVFDTDSGHLWNRLHQALYVRTMKDERIGHDLVDPPLWVDTETFLLSGPSREKALELLDEFLHNDGEKLITDPLKRVVMQHDLWAVFDWTANRSAAFEDPASDGLPAKDEFESARLALRERLAAVIRRLAVDQAAVDRISANYAQAIAAKTWPDHFSSDDPGQTFLPADLLDPTGSWICIRGAAEGPAAPIHSNYYRGRSAFAVYLRLPDGVVATREYIDALNTAAAGATSPAELPQFPVGTSLALVRQMFALDAAGEVMLTPLVQTVQMRVYREVGAKIKNHAASQAMFKFKLDRRSLFAGRSGGLVSISDTAPLVHSILSDHEKQYLKTEQPFMTSCIDCHSCGGGTVQGIFTFDQTTWVSYAKVSEPEQRLRPTQTDRERQRTRAWKQDRHDGRLLKSMIESVRGSAASPIEKK